MQTSQTNCADGTICPSSLACDLAHHGCVLAGQLTSCVGLANGAACDLPSGATGVCDAEVCLSQTCGDGVVSGVEECDGETTATCQELGFYDPVPLVCTPRCTFDPMEAGCTGFCGDGVVNGPEGVEICDGAPPAGSCLDFGFQAGRLGCNDNFCAPALTRCLRIGFTQRTPVSSFPVHDVYVAAADRAYFAAANDLVVLAGSTPTRTSVTNAMFAIWGSSASDVHAVGQFEEIWHFDGTTWTKTNPAESSGSLEAVWGTAPNNVYAVGSNERILHYDGSAWTVSAVTGTGIWYALGGSAANDIWVAGSFGKVDHFTTSWQQVDASSCWGAGTPPAWTDLWVAGANDVFLVGSDGTICHYDGTWTRQESGVAENLESVWGTSPTNVFAVGTGGAVLHYDGASWRRLQTNAFVHLRAVGGAGGTVLVGGDFGDVRAYTGAAYSNVGPASTVGYWPAIEAPAPGVEYALADSGLFRWHDGKWELARSPVEFFWSLAVMPTGEVAVFDTGPTIDVYDGVSWTSTATSFLPFGGLVMRSTTEIYGAQNNVGIAKFNGATWTMLPGSEDTPLEDMTATATQLFACGSTSVITPSSTTSTGAIMRCTAAGSCAAMTIPAVPGLHAIEAIDDTNVFAVGNDGTILHYDGAAWTIMPTGVLASLYAVSAASATDVFAAGAGGLVLHYDGVAWSPVLTDATSQYHSVYARSDLVLLGENSPLVHAIVRDGPW